MRESSRNHLDELMAFQGHDFVKASYIRKTGRTPNAQRIKEICSQFIQGISYFRSAALSQDAVKPLLLYYGVLSLSRGVILLKNTNINEESLKPSHGLEVLDWQSELARGISNISNLKVRVTNGTFSQLIDTTNNMCYMVTSQLPYPSKRAFQRNLRISPYFDRGATFSFDDITSRIPAVRNSYIKSLARMPMNFLCDLAHLSFSTHTSVDIFKQGGPADINNLRSLLSIPNNIIISERDDNYLFSKPSYKYDIPHADAAEFFSLVPHVENYLPEITHLIVPFPSGGNLSPILKTFILAYLLGMLVRYYPSKWMSLLRNEVGDTVFPLASSCIRHIEEDFPEFVLDNIDSSIDDKLNEAAKLPF